MTGVQSFGGKMKHLILCMTLLLSFSAWSQTMKERREEAERKEEIKLRRITMLARTDKLIKKFDSAKEAFSNMNLEQGCKDIDMYVDFDMHILGMGNHMNIFQSKITTPIKDSVHHIRFIFQTIVNCSSVDHENIDPSFVEKNLKNVIKTLKKQRKLIDKESLAFENNFYYSFRD